LQDGDPRSNPTFLAVFLGRAQNLILPISNLDISNLRPPIAKRSPLRLAMR
jgi:hypothetical protein